MAGRKEYDRFIRLNLNWEPWTNEIQDHDRKREDLTQHHNYSRVRSSFFDVSSSQAIDGLSDQNKYELMFKLQSLAFSRLLRRVVFILRYPSMLECCPCPNGAC